MSMRKYILSLLAGLGLPFVLLSQNISSTTTGGNWSDPATWIGAVVPTAPNDVTIADGATVILDVNASALSLSVGEGNSGILEYQTSGAITLTITGDVSISSGAIFRSSLTGTETGHILSVAGNLTNNGVLDFSTNNNTAAASIIFTGSGNAHFAGSGSVTDIYAITIDKGNSPSSILEYSPDNCTFKGAVNTPGSEEGFLDIINGTFKVGGTFTMSNGLFTGTTNYTIPPTGGLWLANPNYTVAGRNGTAYNEGVLTMDAGVLNVGTSSGNRLGYIAGSVFIINGGTINVASRFTATTTFGVSYTQTGGTIVLNTVENARETYASFDIRPLDNSTFNISGGRIVIQHANISGLGPRDYNVAANNMSITGGTLQIGNAATTGDRTFFIQGFAPDIEISNASGPVIVHMLANVASLNTKIDAGCTLRLHDGSDGFVYTQKGAVFLNDGTVDGSLAGSRLVFSGELLQAQSYSGSGSISSPLASLSIDNLLPVSFSNSNAQDIVANELIMVSGDVDPGTNTIILGTGVSNTGTFNYTSGTIIGKFKRWAAASIATLNFPVGTAGFTQLASVDFTSAPATGGTLTAEFVPFPGGSNGLPLTEGIYTILTTSSDGFWRIVAADGFSGGTYTGTFIANNFSTVIDFNNLVLVKRADENAPWVLEGTHVVTSGSNSLAILSRTGLAGFSDFGVGGDLTALPVTVEYFKGWNNGQENRLEWKISCTNTPGATMVLERSRDARRFTDIYSIYATALQCLQPFYFADKTAASGVNYYRLRMADADGKISYSSIIALSSKDIPVSMMQLMPNPVQTNAVLKVYSNESARMEIVITDIQGKRISHQVVSLINGQNNINLSCTGLPSGSYQLTSITETGIRQTLQFIKQ